MSKWRRLLLQLVRRQGWQHEVSRVSHRARRWKVVHPWRLIVVIVIAAEANIVIHAHVWILVEPLPSIFIIYIIVHVGQA